MAKLHFDPQALPIDSFAGESPVALERLTPQALRARFLSPPHWSAETTDEHSLRLASDTHRPASVLVPIVNRADGLTVLLTKRTEHLTNHSGQVSLPGGRWEPHDVSAVETALREAQEEVGLHPRHVEIIGSMPDYFTGTGYRVTPVVGLVHPPFDLVADPFEVADIFEVPLAFLMDGANHQRRSVALPGGSGTRSFYTMPYENWFIWGATAAMLRNLYHFLRA